MNTKAVTAIVAVLALAVIGWFTVTFFEVEASGNFEMPSVDVNVQEGQLPKFDVEQTQETKLPDVDVDADAGNVPEFEVKGPDIEVGTKEVDVPVPDVDVKMEEKTVEVPAIGIEAPGEEEDIVAQ